MTRQLSIYGKYVKFVLCLVVVIIISTSTFGQNDYKRSYKIPDKSFSKTYSHSSGHAIILCDLKKLISHLSKIEKESKYAKSLIEKVKATRDCLLIKSESRDTVETLKYQDLGVKNLIEGYLVDCIVTKKATIVDLRSNKKVTSIYTKKFKDLTPGPGCKWSGYDFFLPRDTSAFLRRPIQLTKYIKFL